MSADATTKERDMSERAATSKAGRIVEALGGDANILDLEPCITRLRAEVADSALVDARALRAAGAIGVVASGNVVQVVVGPEADTLASDIGELR
ncbi:glucose PTS transporter subunit EIIB [Cellulomonas timonensis]|uniref:glucose PTS transporter subunit EIIB n=1 Tax=Cellulomonas timonensis TaxID=1689271 RepID=UPI000AECD82D|nr:glucose PTS transporter subunit EIIB [Cellulomonas timonensis]